MNAIMNLSMLLGGLQDSLINDWIGPIYLVIVAGVAITLIFNRQMRALLIFGIVAIVVGVFVFAGPTLFGDGGALTGAATDLAEQIGNVIRPVLRQ